MKNFKLEKRGQVSCFSIPSFGHKDIYHGFSTRLNKQENFVEILGLKEPFYYLNQVHGNEVIVVEDQLSREKNKVSSLPGDGLVTALREVTLIMFSADCPILFFFDTEKEVVGLAHAGWKGTVRGIGMEMVKTMEEFFNSQSKDILVGISPAIGSCCYEVGEEVIEKLSGVLENWSLTCYPNSQGKWMLNLKEANASLLEKAGIRRDNITLSTHCTCCNPSLFYSYRRSRGGKGRMISFIGLRRD